MRSRPRRPRRRHVPRSKLALRLARTRRSSLAVTLVAVATAGVTGATTKSLLDSAVAAERRWGETTEVDVAVRDVPAGALITAADVRAERRPSVLVPAAASKPGESVGRVALVQLVAGEVIASVRLANDLVPDGWLAIGIPPPGTGAHPDLLAGDAVEVLDVSAPDAVVGAEGVVVGVRRDDGMVTVAVPPADAARVAYAATSGTAVIALTATRPPP